MSEAANPRGEPALRWWALAGAVVVAGTVVRLLAARGDLWLDELWSLHLARGLHSAGAVFSSLHHDNNHHLNTLYLWAVGPGASSLVYRLPAVLAGAGALVIAATAQARLGRGTALIWLVLLAASLLLIQYSSEARGYGGAIFCALACHAMLERVLACGTAAKALVFAALAAAGLLCHLTFLYVLLACWAWAVAAVLGRRAAPSRWRVLALALGPPTAAFAALWTADLRFIEVGGGPPYSLVSVLRDLARAALNLPAGLAEVAGVLCLLAVATEIARLAASRDPEWAFFVVALALGPAAALLLTRPEYLAPRYFAVAAPFALLLLARFLERLRQTGRGGAIASSALVVLFVASLVPGLGRLLDEGRGRYGEALSFIAANSAGPVITVGSDHDFRNGMIIDYYGPAAAAPASFDYLPSRRWSEGAPRWYLAHRFAGEAEPGPLLFLEAGSRYRLVHSFRGAGLSGWDWFLYQREAAPN